MAKITSQMWSGFARANWEKSPVALKATSSELANASAKFLDAKKIFQLLVKFSERCRKSGTCDGIKFYVNGVRLEPFEAIDQLPDSNDLSLESYHQRMLQQFDDYGLVCDGLLEVLGSSDRRKLGSFLRGLYKFTGIPNRFAELGLYLGNYKRTPFGVHVDPCGVMSFPVVGRKTFRLWTPDFVAKNPELQEAFSYDEFKKKSYVLTAERGDMTYWPSSYWHIAEGDGEFSCTWSLGIWVDRPLTDVVVSALSPVIKKSLGHAGARTSLPFAKLSTNSPAELPTELKEAAKKISNLSVRDVEKVLVQWWRDHAGRDGFKK